MTKISTLVNTICISCFFLLLFAVSAWADSECPTLYNYMQNGIGDKFILKGTYDIIAQAASRVAEFSWKTFAQPLQAVVGLGAAIYIALYTLKNVGSFSQQDTTAYLSNDKSGVIPVAIKMTIIVWLLSNQEFIYEYLIGTVVLTGMDIGLLIESDSISVSFASPNNLEGLFALVIQQIIRINNAIYKIVASGQLLLCLAFSPDSIFDYYWRLIPMGAAIYIYGWILILGVSFYMLDILFRLGVGCIMLPMSIACWMSKHTSSYTKKNCTLFMNVSVNFIMLGLIITFTRTMIANCMGIQIEEQKVLTQSDIEYLCENLKSTGFFVTALCCMIAMQLFMQVDDIVDKIVGGNVGSSGKELGGKIGHAAGNAALTTAAATKDAAPILAAAAQDVNNKAGKPIARFAKNEINNRLVQPIARPIARPIRGLTQRYITGTARYQKFMGNVNNATQKISNGYNVASRKTRNGLSWLRKVTRWDD